MPNVTVHWGDGETTTQNVTPDAEGKWSFNDLAHTYDDPGDYQITVDGLSDGSATYRVDIPRAAVDPDPDPTP